MVLVWYGGGEVVVVCMPMSGGHSQDRPSSTRGQS